MRGDAVERFWKWPDVLVVLTPHPGPLPVEGRGRRRARFDCLGDDGEHPLVRGFILHRDAHGALVHTHVRHVAQKKIFLPAAAHQFCDGERFVGEVAEQKVGDAGRHVKTQFRQPARE